jgi:hypothetical protein
VTQPPDHAPPGNDEGAPAKNALRGQLLGDLLGECLSLSHIDSVVAHLYSDNTDNTRQGRLLATIGALLTDGLIVVGDIVGGSDERVEPWNVPLEEVMERLHERYVVHHDSWEVWGWTTWFALTESGQQAARAQQPQQVADQ